MQTVTSIPIYVVVSGVVMTHLGILCELEWRQVSHIEIEHLIGSLNILPHGIEYERAFTFGIHPSDVGLAMGVAMTSEGHGILLGEPSA
jgi:hypothetical protein